MIWNLSLDLAAILGSTKGEWSHQHQRAPWCSSQLSPSGLGSANYNGRPWTLPATAGQRRAAWSEKNRQEKNKQRCVGRFVFLCRLSREIRKCEICPFAIYTLLPHKHSGGLFSEHMFAQTAQWRSLSHPNTCTQKNFITPCRNLCHPALQCPN